MTIYFDRDRGVFVTEVRFISDAIHDTYNKRDELRLDLSLGLINIDIYANKYHGVQVYETDTFEVLEFEKFWTDSLIKHLTSFCFDNKEEVLEYSETVHEKAVDYVSRETDEFEKKEGKEYLVNTLI